MIFHINLNSNLLKSLPNGIFQLKNLKFLDISNNKIGSEGNGYLSEAIANA
jgi:Leucine-rich repeat (LRR) protein